MSHVIARCIIALAIITMVGMVILEVFGGK